MPSDIELFDYTPKVFDDVDLYLFSKPLLGDPMKWDAFLSMVPERHAPYLHYFYDRREVWYELYFILLFKQLEDFYCIITFDVDAIGTIFS